MADPLFYQKQGPFSLNELASLFGTSVEPFPDVQVHDVTTLDQATPHDIAYCDHKKYATQLKETRAGVCLIKSELQEIVPSSTIAIVVTHPRRVFARVTAHFYPASHSQAGISTTAVVHPTAQIASDCQIEEYVVIGPNVVIGTGTRVGTHGVIGAGVQIGKDCDIGPGVHLQYARIGDQVMIKPGAKIGQIGFGFEMDEAGPINIPHLGRVIIEDNVQIGANTAIDRGVMGDTTIGAGSRIDNLVQIAHNVHLGKNCILVAQVGVAGSTRLGDFVIAAGQAGIADHLTIGDGARIAAQSGLMRDVAPREIVAGSPAIPVKDWHRQTIALQQLIRHKDKSDDSKRN